MASDSDDRGFLSVDEPANTLREHHAALCVLEKLDEFWFFENLLKWPLNTGGGMRRLSHEVLVAPLPPFQSLEMVPPVVACAGARRYHLHELPRAHFHTLPTQERDKTPVLNKSGNNGIVNSDLPGSLRESPAARNKALSLNSVAEEESQPLLMELKEEEVDRSDLESAVENSETSASSVKDVGETISLTPSKAETVAPPKEKLLIKRPRRRKQRKTRSIGTEYSELDETRGFRELGFSFSQDKLTPHVISLLPGMKVDYDEGDYYQQLRFIPSNQYKLYSYPAWWTIAKPNSPLYNWQFPDPNQEGVDMKAHLKFWARAVASTVRQES